MIIALQLIAGFILLIVGAEVLVRGASRLAALFGMTPLVIGLTVVALGTSSPEFAVSLQSALSDSSDLAVGNAVGSNTMNVLLILGLSSMVLPLNVKRQVVRIDVPFMILATVALYLIAQDGNISTLEGAAFFGSLIGYIVFSIVNARRQTRAEKAEADKLIGELEDVAEMENQSSSRFTIISLQLSMVLVGLVTLGLGCRLFVDGSVELATLLGLSELVIGLTVVSIGTSLPELVTTLIACMKGERDLAVGNIVGSNLFNILGVLGLTSIVAPGGLPVPDQATSFDIPVTLGAAIILLPIFFAGGRIYRWEGALLFTLYLCYVTYLVMNANEMPAAETVGKISLYGVIPVVVLVLLGSTLLSIKKPDGTVT